MKKIISFKDGSIQEFEANRAGFIQAVSYKESSAKLKLDINHPNNITAASAKSKGGHRGFFQMGESALFETGYYLGDTGIDFRKLDPKKDESKIKNIQETFNSNDWKGRWSGKNGINSLIDFITKPELQLMAVNDWINYLCQRMRLLDFNQYYGQIINGVEVTESGAIASAHLMGEGGLATYLNSPKFKTKYSIIDGNGTHISSYLSMFGGFDLESCCNRKIYISLKDNNGLEIKEKEVIVVSNNNGKFISGETRVKVKSDEKGNLPVIVRNPNTEIKIIADGKESNSIIQKANEKQKATLSDFTVSSYPATLEAENSPQPKPQANKTPQEVRNEQVPPSSPSVDSTSTLKEIQFNVQIVEGDSGKPIPNMNFFLTYKGNIKKHTANNNGVRQGVVAEVGQDIEVSVEGDGYKQVIHHFKVDAALNNQTVKVRLPVHSFSISVTQDGQRVANTLFCIFYRGREIPKRTNASGIITVKMLTGFVFGFGVKGKNLVPSRVEKSVVTKGFTVNASAVKASRLHEEADEQQKQQQAETARLQQQQKEAAEKKEKQAEEERKKAKTEADKNNQARQNNSYTQNGGRPITSVSRQAPVTSDTTRYHIYHNGKIKRENRAATGFAEFIYYDQNGGAHNLGKSRYIVANRWNSKGVKGAGSVFLVDIRPFKQYRNGGVGYKMLLNTSSGRYYLGGLEMAAFLGALCKCGYDDISFNGFSMVDGSPGVSSSHINGVAGDIRYLRKDKKTQYVDLGQSNLLDFDRTLRMIQILIEFNWGKTRRMFSEKFNHNGNANYVFPGCIHMRKDGKNGYRHHHHLHMNGLGNDVEDI